MNKRLGQHFLKSKPVLEKILHAANLNIHDVVLEIGPGTGVLTEALASRAKKVLAVEKDKVLAAFLQKQFARHTNVRIIAADALSSNPTRYQLKTGGYKLVANIPYYITGRLMRLLTEQWPQPKLAVLMVQEEVAKRIAAKPPRMSLMAVCVQQQFTPKIVTHVSRSAFFPQPEVDSAILELSPNSSATRSRKRETSQFFEVVRLGFRHPRKLLASNLERKFPKSKVLAIFKELGVSPLARPAELSATQWKQLANKLT